MMGSLADRSMLHVWTVLPFFAVGTVLLLAAGRGLDGAAARADADGAGHRGCGAGRALDGGGGRGRLRRRVVPHLLRRAVGSSPARLLPASALGGAAVILAADSRYG
jgi:iron complex transport system permease protein